ncbi:MAG: hypothetical protein U9N87_11925 [Planctomycetota bacterium]|nr:hypothetical protein [Planctomycetota bacterium]
MHHSNTKISVLAFLCILIAGSSTATAQYGPWGYGMGLGWGSYPATNAMSAKTTIYNQKAAAQRQSLAQVNQRHTAQNQFLMSQSRGQQSFAASNTWASAESFIQGGRSRSSGSYSGQTVPLALDPNANPAAVMAVTGARSGSAAPATLPTTTLPTTAPGSGSAAPAAKPYDKVVDWPSLLKAGTFRTPRVRVETIMKKAEPGGPGLTESDYKEVMLAINRMKGSLERMSAGLNAKEYLGVVGYLDQLAQRARAAVKR